MTKTLQKKGDLELNKLVQKNAANFTKILRKKAVLERCGFSHTTLYDKVRKGDFPAPVNISDSITGWIESEVEEWLQNRIAQSRNLHTMAV